MRSAARYRSIGDGILVCTSQIKGAGSGLWSSTHFKTNEPITWYDGILLQQRRISGQDLKLGTDSQTHYRAVKGMDMVIDGLRGSDRNILGRGGGSIINHWPERANCRYQDSRSDNLRMICSSDGVCYEIPATIIIATRPILPKEEFFIDYGQGVRRFQWWRQLQSGLYILCVEKVRSKFHFLTVISDPEPQAINYSIPDFPSPQEATKGK